ncbi:hypothetical protein HDU99_000936 [Rhizoclosmatium hyalinum]|nr:hypothetical protein HDU99_000936 [Rhizoclosmatium hyalinum]
MTEIHWEDRFENWENLKPSCYVDGTDCPTHEIHPFDSSLYGDAAEPHNIHSKNLTNRITLIAM